MRASLSRSVLATLLLTLTGCAQIIGIEDAEPRAVAVSGGGDGGSAGAGGQAGSAGTGGQAGSPLAGQEPGGQGGGAGQGCAAPSDCPGSDTACQSRTCTQGVCGLLFTTAGTTCSDAGGKKCDGKGACIQCLSGNDCDSGLCDGGACLDASCGDQLKNAGETDIDCGGSCGPCADTRSCVVSADCQSAVCEGGACQAPSCADATRNAAETDVDCGGPACPRCSMNKACEAFSDCASGVCAGNRCQPPSCADGVQNGNELDVDCGGSCGKCADGQACKANEDCQGDLCVDGLCQPPTCTDGLKNGAETGLDCGGTCAGCGLGEACLAGSDCLSSACVGGQCQPYIIALGGGDGYTCAVHGGGQLKCWGRNQTGSLGQGNNEHLGDEAGEMGENLPPVDLGTNARVKAVSRGLGLSTCAILETDALKCWGLNDHGQLGLGDNSSRGDDPDEMGNSLPTVDLGGKVKAVTVGTRHTCAILIDGSVKCWGLNDHGQLGLGDTSDRGAQKGEMGSNLPTVKLGAGRTAEQIAAGATHTCALLDDKSVKCWGSGSEDRLFNGKPGFNVGDKSGQMGDLLAAAKLGTGRTAREIAVAAAHTCILLDDKTVKCQGDNISNGGGFLGLGDTVSHQDQSGDELPRVELGGAVAHLAAGNSFMCALLESGAVKCWGHNDHGQLGLGDTSARGDEANEMGDHLPAVQPGFSPPVLPLTLFVGSEHACAVAGDRQLKCWGYNGNGALGLGDTDNRGDEQGEMGSALPLVAF